MNHSPFAPVYSHHQDLLEVMDARHPFFYRVNTFLDICVSSCPGLMKEVDIPFLFKISCFSSDQPKFV